MKSDEVDCSSAEEKMKRDERGGILYREIKGIVSTVRIILSFSKRGDLDKQTAESNCLLAVEELRGSLERYKEEWGEKEMEEVWKCFKVWRKDPLLKDVYDAKATAQKLKMPIIEKKMEDLEKYIRRTNTNFEKYTNIDSAMGISEKVKHFFCSLARFK